MDVFQEFFVTAMAALIFSCIIVKLVSFAVSNAEKIDKNVIEESKIAKGLVVKSKKGKKRVIFVEKQVVKNVDQLEIKDSVELIMPCKAEGLVDQSCDKGVAKNDVVEKKVENFLKKGDDLEGEKLVKDLLVIEQCVGGKAASDDHDEGKVEVKKIDELVDVKEKDLVNSLVVGDDFEGEMLVEDPLVNEQCGGGREVSDAHDEGKVEVKKIDELVDVKEKDLVNSLVVGDDFEGEKLVENLLVIEQCSGKKAVSDGHDEGKVEVKKIDELEKDLLNCLVVGDDFEGEKLVEDPLVIEQCGGGREVSDAHDEGKVEVKKIDKLVDVKEKDLVNALVVSDDSILEQSLVDDEVKLGKNEVIEVGGGLSKVDETMAMDEDSDDDWEGIERSELEEEFVKAINFVDERKGKDGGLENLGSELMIQLYGLQKIAMEGPCYEPQPMALKLTARAKWNAWQRMGSMSPEVAMEQYIKLVSDHVPGWTHHIKGDREVGSSESIMLGAPDSVPDSFNDICKDERTQEMNHAAVAADCAISEKGKE